MQKILIVSDKYPPFQVGGAEVSLSNIVNSITYSSDVTFEVISFCDSAADESVYEYKGVKNHAIKLYDPFLSYIESVKRKRTVRRLINTAKFLFTDQNAPMKMRLRYVVLGYLIFKKKISNYVFPLIDENFINARNTEKIRKIIDEFNPDLIHADNFRSIMLVNSAAPKARVVNLIRDHRFFCPRISQPASVDGKECMQCDLSCLDGMPPQYQEINSLILSQNLDSRHKVLSSLDDVIVTSEYMKAKIIGISPNSKPTVIPNPMDMDCFGYTSLRRDAGLNHPIIIIIGVINPNKGQLDFLNVLKELVKKYPDIELRYIGRGDAEMAQIRLKANELDIEKNITFVGHLGRKEIYREYINATVVACPTIWPEPFGRVPLEAAAFKRVVVSYAVAGLKESIDDGRTGFLINKYDYDEFIKKVSFVIDNPEKASEMGNNAYGYVMEKYGIHPIVDAFKKKWGVKDESQAVIECGEGDLNNKFVHYKSMAGAADETVSSQKKEEQVDRYIEHIFSMAEISINNWLDVGCGQGDILKKLKQISTINLYGIDLYDKYISGLNDMGINGIHGNIADVIDDLISSGIRFDVITINHVIEHIAPDEASVLFQKMPQLLNDGGMMVIVTPNFSDTRVIFEKFYSDLTHIRPYGVEAIKFLFNLASISIKDYQYYDKLGEKTHIEYNRGVFKNSLISLREQVKSANIKKDETLNEVFTSVLNLFEEINNVEFSFSMAKKGFNLMVIGIYRGGNNAF